MKELIKAFLDTGDDSQLRQALPDLPQIEQSAQSSMTDLSRPQSAMNKSPNVAAFEIAVMEMLLRTDITLNEMLQLLDVCIHFRNQTELSVFLVALGFAMEIVTISQAEDLFKYSVDKKVQLDLNIKPYYLLVLKLCNRLLKRSDNLIHAEFRGGIYVFLADVLPLDHKTGLNQLGAVNSSQAQQYQTLTNDGSLTDDEFADYLKFYSVQQYYCDPMSNLVNKTGVELNSAINDMKASVVQCLYTIKKSRIETELPPPLQYPVSASSYKILLADRNFQAIIVYETFMFLRFLRNHFVTMPPYADLVEWIDDIAKEAMSWIGQIDESIKTLIRAVVVKEEDNWVQWQAKGFASEEKDPVKLKPFVLPDILPYKPSYNLGTPELHELFRPIPVSKGGQKTLEDMLKPLREQMDPENMIEEEYRLSNNSAYCFRVLRKMQREPGLNWQFKRRVFNKLKKRFDPELLIQELDKLKEM